MPMDLQRILEAAAQAAVADPGPDRSSGRRNGQPSRRGRRRLKGMRAFLVGAGVVTAGRLVTSSRRGELLDGLQQRLIEYEHRHFGDEAYNEVDDADLPEDELDEDNEPADDEPEDELDEDTEPEDEHDEDTKAEANQPQDEHDEDNEPEDAGPEDDQPADEYDEEAEPPDGESEDALDEDPEPSHR